MLKVLMLRKRLDDKRKERAALDAIDFEKREAEIATAIEEAATEEERAAVEAEIDKFEADKAEHAESVAALDEEIRGIEAEIAAEEAKQDTGKKPKEEKREDKKAMINREKFFGMNYAERDEFFAREDVKDFIQRVKELRNEKRALTGADLLVPTVVLDLIRENVIEYSKLYKHVRVRQVPGKARQIVMGAIPEAVWTEMCATLNELNLAFTGVEVDGYKVGGYIAICNALLEDSDIALMSEVITALGQAIGLALDKAILYGTGTKMPLGIVTRLAQTEQPTGWAGTIPWSDLHTSNIKTHAASVTGAALFQAIIGDAGAAKGKYSRGAKFWAMNESTYTALIVAATNINAAGAIVAGVNGEMPVVGGRIEVLSFIPDNVIIGGYGDLYLLAERAGTAISQSEHARFIEDQTVVKGTARYDGRPVIAEGFVAIAINGGTVSAGAVTFAQDTANA